MTSGIYITAAFKSINYGEAYIFMKDEYVIDEYAPIFQKDDRILIGPAHIRDHFCSLKNTVFGNQGIDCAFATHDDYYGTAYIFSGKMCAKWLYRKDQIVERPKSIVEMFPFLKETVFENGIDAAFESTCPSEAHIFKGSFHAVINYDFHDGRIIKIAPIYHHWPCLRGTIFEDGFDAAFALHDEDQAYLFKGDSFAHIKFTPKLQRQKLKCSNKIKDSWKGLGSILPR